MDVVSPLVVVGRSLTGSGGELSVIIGVDVGGEVKIYVVKGNQDVVGRGD